jgi:hypothetical protein
MTARRVVFLLVAVACGTTGEAAVDSSGTPAQAVAPNHDPCALLTKAEAEAVLGTLSAAPYRSKEDTTEAAPAGPTCTYPTKGGGAFLLTPEWTYGKMILDTERMFSGLARLVTTLPGVVSADTLEGQWDDVVVGMTGVLVFRKGARSLTISYLNSSTNAAGAIRLSGPALKRLAAVPEPKRAVVSGKGCPLPPDVVTKLLEMPVRVAPGWENRIGACAYTLDDDPMVEVELSIQPSEVAPMAFEELHNHVKGLMGMKALPDSVPFGDKGWAYGSRSGSEAAVLSGERLYHAKMIYMMSTTTPPLKDAMVRLVAAMMANSRK